MRSLWLTLLLIPLLLVASGCKRRHSTAGEAQQMVSTINAADPSAAGQFARGFYGVEGNAWRWTSKEFAVDLLTPLHSNQDGAQLTVKLAVPDAVMQKTNSVQLTASLDGYKLEPQTYTKAGSYTFTRDLPAAKLQNGVVRIDFALDHSLPPTGSDVRELGIVVSEVGLTAK
jgi:hypothetical protein